MTDTNASKPVLTKEEKIKALKEQIARLEVRLFNVENDIAEPARVKKEVALPQVGDTVSFVYGRKTTTTEPKTITGVVVAVKPSAEVNGKKTPAQVKVSYGEGFDAEFATVYPAQLTIIKDAAAVDGTPASVQSLYDGTAE